MSSDELPTFVESVIYKATCVHPESKRKVYIGQTRSHVLNHGVYRRFGAMKRWDQHMSEAKTNNTSKQSWKLNNAIRKYGSENFEITVLGECTPDAADLFEMAFIRLYNSVKEGYNITYGGHSGVRGKGTRQRISKTLGVKNDEKRIEQFSCVQISQITITTYMKTGVGIIVCGTDTKANKPISKRTNFYGMQITFEDALARAKAVAHRLAGGDTELIEISKTLKKKLGGETVKLLEPP